jgi:hypothetical protein
MRAYELDHLDDRGLLGALAGLVAQERTATTALLAHLAEVDARRLYLPAGYPTMFAYCVDELHFSEDAACKRIRAARAARQYPALFEALADGRLNLSGVVLLAPHLTEGNASELIVAAAKRRRADIEEMLARRFPRSELLAMEVALPSSAPRWDSPSAPGRMESHAVQQLPPKRSVTPIAPDRFALQLTIGGDTHDKLKYAKALLSH